MSTEQSGNPYESLKVVGTDRDGGLICEDNGSIYNSGETLADFGVDNLTPSELRTLREQKLDAAYAGYDFGDGVQVTEADGWLDDGTNDITRIVYVEFDEGGSDRVSFHVRFTPGTVEIEEVYGLLMSSGNWIGSMPSADSSKKASGMHP